VRALDTIIGPNVKGLSITLDRINRDDRGFLVLSGSESNAGLKAAFQRLRGILRNLADEFPKERIAWESDDHAPKFLTWRPHITIGMAFHRDGTHLPLPLKDRPTSRRLATPITFSVSQLAIVHYAYRSLLRCIGELTVPLNRPVKLTPERVTHALQI
jgi:hypothetical protein